MKPRFLGLLAAGLLLISPTAWANDLPKGTFDEPKKLKHGKPLSQDWFHAEGGKTPLTRFVGPARHERSAALLRGATLEALVKVPAAMPAAAKIKPEGWYGVASVDVLGLNKSGKATITLSIAKPGSKRALVSTDATIEHVAPKGGKTTTEANVTRLWVKLPSETFRQYHSKELAVRLEVKGTGRVVLDDLQGVSGLRALRAKIILDA